MNTTHTIAVWQNAVRVKCCSLCAQRYNLAKQDVAIGRSWAKQAVWRYWQDCVDCASGDCRTQASRR